MSEGPLPTSIFKGLEFLFFFAAILGVVIWQLIRVSREIKKDEAADEANPREAGEDPPPQG